jgi:hypothetical protein
MPNILVEPGADSSHLLIAFTGFQGALTMAPFDFFSASGHLRSSRILLRDPSHLMYLTGCPPDARGFHTLLDRIGSEIERLAPQRITCVGTSSGGFAAMLFGHLLQVYRVHAFAPSPFASVWMTIANRDWHQLRRYISPKHLLLELRIPWSLWKYRNLPRVLRQGNGKTRYTLHVCAQNENDMRRARYFADCPQVEIAAHECSTHQVARHLVREGKLLSVFQEV